jgi:putative transposase
LAPLLHRLPATLQVPTTTSALVTAGLTTTKRSRPQQLAQTGRNHLQLGRALARRQGPDRRTGSHASNRWQRAVGRLGRAHARVANLRRDGLHKLTSRLARQYATVVVEDLNVTGMLRNRRVARHVADAAFAQIRRQLVYKTQCNGGRLPVADRWYPSSKTCSGCGAAKAKLALSERTYTCGACGLVMDRDRNAARNLAALAAEYDTAGNGPWQCVEPTGRPAYAGRWM